MLGKLQTGQEMEVLRRGDLIADNRLLKDAPDLLEHDSIARGVAEIARSAEAPVNIALFGAWGSGKSSVYSMIEAHLERIAPKRVRIARYDAWKYGGRELKRNFINSLAHELDLDDKPEFSDGLENEQVETKLETGKWVKRNLGSLVVGVLLAGALAALWILAQAAVVWLFTDHGFKATTKVVAVGAGTVFGLALIAALVGPKAFDGAVTVSKAAAPEGSDQFAKRFSDLVNAALKGKYERLVVFVDELDRCDPKDVVATLIDLKTFLDQEGCVFIVAADREVIERALREVPQAKPVREDEPYYATPGAFLDKIFQHQLALPPLRSRALTKFAHDLVDPLEGGIWEELRDAGQDTFDRTVFALVPVHVRSPRRVKVLLNNFATNARIVGSRGLSWLDRAHEIAVLTVLQTEFPAVADELRRVPRLLVYLRGEDEAAPELQKVVDLYRVVDDQTPLPPVTATEDGDEEPTETVAGRLLSEDGSVAGAREREIASRTLRRHLANYLSKVAAAGIRDPRPDLLYLQVAGGREALADPKLGDVIDFATDTAPDTVVEAFADATSATLAVAIPLLVTEGDGESGPGRQFAYESACRLIEQLDPDDHDIVAQLVAPSLIAAVNAETLSDASLPGALLVACWAGRGDVVTTALNENSMRGGESLLDGLTVLLPYLDDAQTARLAKSLAERYSLYPKPLMTALRKASVESAVGLWGSVADKVLTVLNDLELPEAEEPAATTAATPRAAAAAVADPEPTGVGISHLNEIVDVVRERADHEALLSAVLATAQSAAAVEPLRDWVAENVDSLLRNTMSSPTRLAKHALVGMNRYRGPHRDLWAGLLPDADDAGRAGQDTSDDAIAATAQEVTALANQLLGDLLNKFAEADAAELRALPALVAKVASWSSATDQEVAASVADALADAGWAGGDVDDAAGQLLWDRKKHLLGTVKALGGGEDSAAFAPFVVDLMAMLKEVTLTPVAADGWRKLASELPPGSAETLSAELDDYLTVDEPPAAFIGLRLTVRLVYGGDALPANDLLALDPVERTTTVTDAWLALRPRAEDARAVLVDADFTPAALRQYSDTLDTDERTELWLALRASGAPDQSLEAAGAGGLGCAAVDTVRSDVAPLNREPDRTVLVEQLMAVKPAADVINDVKKSASDLALDLIGNNTAGDLRTAAKLVIWAGGAGRGSTLALREKFNGAPEHQRKDLRQAQVDGLVALKLLNPPPPPPPKKKKRGLFG